MKSILNNFAFKTYSVLILLLILSGFSEVFGQTYCSPQSKGCLYEYSYAYYGIIQRITITGPEGTVYDKNSGLDGNGYTIWTDSKPDLVPGTTYNITIVSYNLYYAYTRLFIDWNQDGKFVNTPGNTEYYGQMFDAYYLYGNWDPYYGYQGTTRSRFTFTVPINATGDIRFRAMTSYQPNFYYYYNYPTYYYSYPYDDACMNGYWYDYTDYYGYCFYYTWGETEDFTANILVGVKNTFPGSGDILFANELYDGSSRLKNGNMVNFTKPSVIFPSTPRPGAAVNYYIFGPAPSTTKVYEALQPYPGNSTDVSVYGKADANNTYAFEHAQGTFAYPKAPYSDGSFKSNRGGTYKAYAFLLGSPRSLINEFSVSWDNDLAASSIISPKTNEAPQYFKYITGQTLKVAATFRNVGINDVSEFYAIASIWDPDGQQVYRDSVKYSAPPSDILKTGGQTEIDFRNARFTRTGSYTMLVKGFLLNSVTGDQDSYNDQLPRPDDNSYTFEISYEIQLQANLILVPSNNERIFANRPFIPKAIFKNVGIGDASDVPATLVIKNSAGQVITQSNINIQDLPAGKYNTSVVTFDQTVIKQPGTYKAFIWLTAPEDVVRNDDTLSNTFVVESGLSGNYTVGTQFQGQSNNYATIEDLMNDLYLKGITGSVTFELTDSKYVLNSSSSSESAWDFSSKIIGLGYNPETNTTNTITWKPHITKASSAGSITFELHSTGGKGVQFGQSFYPPNDNAIARRFPSPQNINSPGYIIFDGGSQRAFNFVLYSGNNYFGSAFYLNRGSHNITIKNCEIQNATPAIASNTYVPLVSYNSTQGYQFQPDISGSGANIQSYSAGIAIRNTLLTAEESNFIRMDTVPNTNNNIENNDISGFGYGILSLGLGTLYLPNSYQYGHFYNNNNMYQKNVIHDISRAGILLGFEENSDISGNRIFNVRSISGDAAGILAGGNSSDKVEGYNNINLRLNGNEISGISASSMVDGIRIEQVRRSYPNPKGGEIFFPDISENFTMSNNVVWGLSPSNPNASVMGIHLYTRRDATMETPWEMLITPYASDYSSRDDKIVNNTIWLNEDGMTNSGPITGIGIQQATNTYFYNNAIAFTDNSLDLNGPIASAVFYQGIAPKSGGLNSDRNAIYLNSNDKTVFRFIETDKNSNVLEIGDRNEYSDLDQWQIWSGQDKNSVFGNFVKDFAPISGSPSTLRIQSNPLPVGSLLNNRGEKISFLTTDIDGNRRGAAGQRYDIGAFEFDGKMFINDVEMVLITSPRAFRASSGTFSDAEYVMTTAPVDVRTLLRNSGTLLQSDINVNVQIFKESYIDGVFNSTPVIDKTVKATIPSAESSEISFNLAGQGTQFNPQTYAESGPSYGVPLQFSTMANNVTPRYKIVTSVESDQNNGNNSDVVYVRFYIKKSPLDLLVSAENSMSNIYNPSPLPSQDQIAGRLNTDYLITGLHDLGWFTQTEINRNDVDLFDRLGWEQRTVNYNMYKTMFWSDGDDKPLSRYQRLNLRNFLNEGTTDFKHNLIIGSQEMVREQMDASNPLTYDPEFVNSILRANDEYPSNPLGMNVSNNGNKVKGVAVGRDLVELISSTNYKLNYDNGDGTSTLTDVPPYCGLVSVYPEGEGLAKVAYNYLNTINGLSSTAAGVATTTLTRNVVLLGVDWRHWNNMDRVLRSVLDFIDKNGGALVPVELANFDAIPVGKRVDIKWSTASEINTSRFEIERAAFNEAGRSQFTKIDELPAAGKSADLKQYGPVSDFGVDYGKTYAYRLKMIDLDGSFNYSSEKVVTIDAGNGISLSNANPNPATDEVSFNLVLGSETNVDMTIYDLNGKEVKVVSTGSMPMGSKKVDVDLRTLSAGSYTLVLKSNGIMINRQFNVVK